MEFLAPLIWILIIAVSLYLVKVGNGYWQGLESNSVAVSESPDVIGITLRYGSFY
jgi:hypothetical protein